MGAAMERGNDVVQPTTAPATTTNVGTMSGSMGNMSTDVGGVDMGGLNVSAAGGAARGGAKEKDKDPPDASAANRDPADEVGPEG
jgi:hypothetical protein